MKVKLLLSVAFSFALALCFAQNKKAVEEADKYFGIKAYDQAFPLYKQAIDAGEKNPVVYFRAAPCLQK